MLSQKYVNFLVIVCLFIAILPPTPVQPVVLAEQASRPMMASSSSFETAGVGSTSVAVTSRILAWLLIVPILSIKPVTHLVT